MLVGVFPPFFSFLFFFLDARVGGSSRTGLSASAGRGRRKRNASGSSGEAKRRNKIKVVGVASSEEVVSASPTKRSSSGS